MSAYRAKAVKGAAINWGDPLANGLVCAFLFNDNAGPRIEDAARGASAFTATGAPVWSGGIYGRGLAFDAIDDSLLGGIPRTTLVTVLLLYGAPASISGNPSPFVQGDDAFNSAVWDWGFYHSALTTLVCHVQDNTNVNLTITAGVMNRILMVRKDTDTLGRIYLNGKVASSTGAIGTLSNAKALRTLSGSQRSAGRVESLLGWSRALTAADARALESDPFRMFRRRSVPVPIHAGAAAGAQPSYLSLLGVG